MSELLDEGKLRAQLRDLAEEAAAPAAPAAPVGPVMAAARRQRARRRAGPTVTASVVAVTAAVTVSYGLTRPHSVVVPVGGASSMSSSATPSAAASLPARTFDRNDWQTGPAAPVLGQAYPFDLLVHCGLRYATFGGKGWETTQAVTVPHATPDPVTGVTEGMVALPGYMTLQDASTARFDNARLASPVTFHVLDPPAPGCA